ncbi:MAG TPA: nuclear transport factor 2 family protein [Acidimicrobiales bacterium]|nr:nuclear transport factor 2 family protein [Acidimicrobiales bacterium]
MNEAGASSQVTPPHLVVEEYIDALNAHNADLVCSFVADDFWNEHTSVRGESVRGRETYRNRLEGFFSSMQDLNYEIERALEHEGQVVVAYRMTARWAAPKTEGNDKGDLRPFSIRGVFWFEVVDGRITHRVDYRDGVDFEQQVGLRS